MSLTVFHGLPTHVLLVHVVVVLVPLTALALVVGAVWPRAARGMGLVLPLLALLTLASVPFTTHAGEWLKGRLPPTEMINRHAGLGDDLLPWVSAMLAVSLAVWWLARHGAAGYSARGGARVESWTAEQTEVRDMGRVASVAARFPRALRASVAALALAAAIGSVVYVYRIGDSGAKATWQGVVSQPAGQGGHGRSR